MRADVQETVAVYLPAKVLDLYMKVCICWYHHEDRKAYPEDQTCLLQYQTYLGKKLTSMDASFMWNWSQGRRGRVWKAGRTGTAGGQSSSTCVNLYDARGFG